MLSQAERMHRQFFQLQRTQPAWEPPADVLETDNELVVLMALPAVDPEKVEAQIEGNELVVSGVRAYPSELGTALIHRLELPQGRFHRRLPLPGGHYTSINHQFAQGCLVLRLQKA